MRSAGLEPHSDPRHLHWKYWQERSDWSGSRSFVLTNGPDLLAHVAVVPGAILYDGTRARVIHMIDWAARREAVGAGTRLAKHIAATSDFTLATGGSRHSLRIQPRMGYVDCGTIAGYARTLSPLGILGRPSASRWKLLPRMARSLFWSLATPRTHMAGWQVRRIESDEIQQTSLPLPTQMAARVVFERSPVLLRHALACPMLPTELYGLEKDRRIGGYFLLSYAPGQARVADMWLASDDPADWRALIHAAVHRARSKKGLAELIVWSSDPTTSRILLDCGFHERLSLPISLLASPGTSLPRDIMRVQMLDSDAFYLHIGGDELWA
ncbi:MAG: hypothetical protein ACREVO_13505 [Steroidobacteraceae bacterium]